jgi:uncharacterized membrane protein YhhN
MQGRISMLEVLVVEAAALATATAVHGLPELHRVFKPVAMGAAIIFVAARAVSMRLPGTFSSELAAALVFSLAGDWFLLQPGGFIPGLVCFLIAHLCYIALFRGGVPWFPSRKALAATLGIAGLMYATLFPNLGPVLKGAVAAYAAVIALMAAQAIGRATVLRDKHALGVAVGACFFMLSDALLAINKFAMPIPLAPLWVLATYYTAQLLIVHHALRAQPVSATVPRSTAASRWPGQSAS